MKARHIKKLRKIVAKYKPFTVSVCIGLFGFGYDSCGGDAVTLMALNIEGAIRKYFKRYERKYKEKSNKHITFPEETTRRWGKVMVVDNIGYKTFWR